MMIHNDIAIHIQEVDVYHLYHSPGRYWGFILDPTVGVCQSAGL